MNLQVVKLGKTIEIRIAQHLASQIARILCIKFNSFLVTKSEVIMCRGNSVRKVIIKPGQNLGVKSIEAINLLRP